jgi:hypothetical protein
MKTNHRSGHRKRRDNRSSHYCGSKQLMRTDTNSDRRGAERAAIRALASDPEADVPLPIQNRHAGNPWRWD